MSPRPSTFLRSAGFAGILGSLGACAVGPDFVRPAAPVADRYTVAPLPATTPAADGRTQSLVPNGTSMAEWWRLFESPPLDAVVRQALANSPTLQAAEASLRQSQDNLRAGFGLFYPHATADLGVSRERSAPSQQGLATRSTVFNLVTLSGTVSYALDVFGGERRAVEGLRAQTDYQRYAMLAAYLPLSANVVNTCIARAAYVAEIRATEQLIGLEQEQLRLTEVQVRAGTAPYANLLSIRSLLSANQAALAPLRQRVGQAEDLLATLEGVVPAQAILPELELTALALPTRLPVSLPSDLVRQRPDILAAEAQWHAANANIGVATAAMFPSFNLTGTSGAAAPNLGRLSAADSRFWSIGPSASIPLFQGGTLWFGRKAAIEAGREAEANYRQTVLGAFAQVADSLQALVHDAEALQAQTEAWHTAGEALGLLQVNYRAGLVAYPDVLVADVQFHEATIAYLPAVAQRHQDTVALFVALGGGWWNQPLLPNEGGAR